MAVPDGYYRVLAKAEREAAAKESLPSRRAMRERSAQTWEEMAERVEDTMTRAQTNAVAKAQTTNTAANALAQDSQESSVRQVH